jgi:hypothetical protein
MRVLQHDKAASIGNRISLELQMLGASVEHFSLTNVPVIAQNSLYVEKRFWYEHPGLVSLILSTISSIVPGASLETYENQDSDFGGDTKLTLIVGPT